MCYENGNTHITLWSYQPGHTKCRENRPCKKQIMSCYVSDNYTIFSRHFYYNRDPLLYIYL